MVPRGRAQLPSTILPLVMDPGMWLDMVNVKPPYLEISIWKLKE